MRKGPPYKRYVTAFGRIQSLHAWAAEVGIDRGTLRHRIVTLGWHPERALTERTLTPHETGTNAARACAAMHHARMEDALEYDSGDEAWPGANDTPWSQDKTARRVVNELGGMTLAQIGACLGLSREGVRQTLLRAIAKCEAADAKTGRVLREIAEGMSDDDGEVTYPDWMA